MYLRKISDIVFENLHYEDNIKIYHIYQIDSLCTVHCIYGVNDLPGHNYNCSFCP